jgi:hypothetical protein
MLAEVRLFCEGLDASRRFLACGICWAEDFIATNTLHLHFLLGKSKSSINGAFAKMGFDNGPGTDADCVRIAELMPQLRVRTQEIRQWTVRRNGPIVEPRRLLEIEVPTPTAPPPVQANYNPDDWAEQYEFEPFEQFDGGEDLTTEEQWIGYDADFTENPCGGAQCPEPPDSKSNSSPGPCA